MPAVTAESQRLRDQDVENDVYPELGLFGVVFIIYSIVVYVGDVGFDIFSAYVHYRNQNTLYFVLTLVFIIIPAFTVTGFSSYWYISDLQADRNQEPDNQTPRPSRKKWIIRCIFLFLLINPLHRYVNTLINGWKSHKAANSQDKKKYLRLLWNEAEDTSLLRLFEAFMEAAPQATLQLCILIKYYGGETQSMPLPTTWLFLGVVFSFLSIAGSMVSFSRSVRAANTEKQNVSIPGSLLQFCWHFFIISARIFALSAVAASYPVLLILGGLLHWIAMMVWLRIQSDARDNLCEESIYNFAVGFVYIFAFLNIKMDEKTQLKYIMFYMICFIENTILLITWIFLTSEASWLPVIGTVIDYLFFFIGLSCMMLYYYYLHPSKCSNSKAGSNT